MRKQTFKAMLFGMAVMTVTAYAGLACTNFLITKGASTDGSTMISY